MTPRWVCNTCGRSTYADLTQPGVSFLDAIGKLWCAACTTFTTHNFTPHVAKGNGDRGLMIRQETTDLLPVRQAKCHKG